MDFDPLQQPPIDEEDQVITIKDLRDVIEDMSENLICLPITHPEYFTYYTIIDTLRMLIKWVEDGKP